MRKKILWKFWIVMFNDFQKKTGVFLGKASTKFININFQGRLDYEKPFMVKFYISFASRSPE